LPGSAWGFTRSLVKKIRPGSLFRYGIMREYLPKRGRRARHDASNGDGAGQLRLCRKTTPCKLRRVRLSPIVTAMLPTRLYEGASPATRRARRVCLGVDPDRQGLLPSVWSPKSRIRDYVEWALSAPMFLFKRDGKVVRNTGQTFRAFMRDGFEGHAPNSHDWEMHLNTLFPEVRLKHTLEVRGGDSLLALFPALRRCGRASCHDDDALASAEALSAKNYVRRDAGAKIPLEITKLGLAATFRSDRSPTPPFGCWRSPEGVSLGATGCRAMAKRVGAPRLLMKLVEHGGCPPTTWSTGYRGSQAARLRIIRRTKL
jgi:glutamate--cysteine ligase